MSTEEAPIYGKFGDLSQFYATARKQYPREVIDLVCSTIPKDGTVLDLACGTGIATRQITERGFRVLGIDSSAGMLSVAAKYPNITYQKEDAESLSLPYHSFAAGTCFGAFHWFDRKPQAISQIRRVLVIGGMFNVVNKNDRGNFRDDYLKIIAQVLRHQPVDIKRGYNPKRTLNEAGFEEVTETKVDTVDRFSLEDLLQQYQSMSHWDLLKSDEAKAQALTLLTEDAQRKLVNGFVEREMEVVVVRGRN